MLAGFEIPVHDTLLVRGTHARHDLAEDGERARHREAALTSHHLPQGEPVHERHGDVLDAVDFTEVVDAYHVGVRDLPGEHQLALEAAFGVDRRGRIGADAGSDGLDGDGNAKLVVPRLVDGAHAAHAEQLDDVVAVAERLAGLQLVVGTRSNPTLRCARAFDRRHGRPWQGDAVRQRRAARRARRLSRLDAGSTLRTRARHSLAGSW